MEHFNKTRKKLQTPSSDAFEGYLPFVSLLSFLKELRKKISRHDCTERINSKRFVNASLQIILMFPNRVLQRILQMEQVIGLL